MVAIVKVVNEPITIASPANGPSPSPGIVTVLTNISALNNLGQTRNDSWLFPPTLQLILLDIPALDEKYRDDPFWFAFVYSPSRQALWEGGFIDVSYDDGVTWDLNRAEISQESSVGFVVDDTSTTDRNLGDALPDRWDGYSKVTVEMISGELSSAPREQVLAGANMLYIGGEFRAFSTATEIDPVGTLGLGKTYELTDWIRGMRGTTIVDPAPTGFPGDETLRVQPFVIDLTSSYVPVRLPSGDADVMLQYRARARNYSGVEIPGSAVALAGENLRPFPVHNIAAVKEANSDWTITWNRVTRSPDPQIFSARGVVDADTPAFDVVILDSPGGAVKRTKQVTVDAATYTLAEQSADFGSDQATLFVKVMQTSAWLNGSAVEAQF